MSEFIDFANRVVWGVAALVLILGVGICLSIRTRFVQLTLLPRAVRLFGQKLCGRKGENGVSSFQALCTALAATVGTGNLVGVAGAIALGGPGSIFWMWLCALLGMVTKFAEATLAVHFRVRHHGEYVGGPMYLISRGLGDRWRILAAVYSMFGIFAAFGVGNATQINAVIGSVNQVISQLGGQPNTRSNLGMGILLSLVVGYLLLGGSKRIGETAELLMPFASCVYILLCIGVLVGRRQYLPQAFHAIFCGAFAPRAMTGGVVGSWFAVLRVGVSRGVFTNEAGMGTASIAHAAADVAHPVEQGMMGMIEVFLDTVVICTLTALVILCSGVKIPYGEDAGVSLTATAFSSFYGNWVNLFLSGAMCLFAFATILGWGLYGARCAQYLFGSAAWKPFALVQTAVVVLGAVMKTQTIWAFAEMVNGLMAIPNLIALVGLSGVLRSLTSEYQMKRG